jgi:DNA adenine methylase
MGSMGASSQRASQLNLTPMSQLTGILPWVGSKRQLRDHIITKIPEHVCYAEVFTGAGWVYLGKEPSEVEVINDVNGDLINLYRVIKTNPQELFEAVWYMLPSRESYLQSRDALKKIADKNSVSDIERAALFYFHIKNAFGAKFGSGFAFSKARPPRAIIGYDLLVNLRDRLARTYIENLSFERLIKHYDSPDTFFYLDPPYVKESGYVCYQFEFTLEEHAILAKILHGLKGKFPLSYGDTKWIRQAYQGFKIERTPSVTYSLSGKPKSKTELLISNY